MIRLFSSNDKIFTSNGDAVIQPSKAKVHKEDNGKFYSNYVWLIIKIKKTRRKKNGAI